MHSLYPTPKPANPAVNLVRWFLAAVWLVNGLWCKVLGQVPRHEAIAARVLSMDAGIIIKVIGLGEIGMAAWILSRIAPRLNAITQVSVVLTMNVLEIILAPDLLLFGRLNGLIACLFAALILADARPFHPVSNQTPE